MSKEPLPGNSADIEYTRAVKDWNRQRSKRDKKITERIRAQIHKGEKMPEKWDE